MVDILENFVDDTALTVKNVRALVDDYSLISHYLGQELELHTKYSSPLREGDENPSFSMFFGYGQQDSNKLFFKDQIGIAQGDVYEFLQLYLKAKTVQEVLEQVNYDLSLGLNSQEKNLNLTPSMIKKIPMVKERAKINVVSQLPTKAYLNYWRGKYDIQDWSLDMYLVKCIRDIHYVYSDKTTIISPKTLSIGYPIGDFNKIYMPFETKENKFRNDYPQNYVEGHIQLDWSRNDLLIITKSMKECIFFRNHWNIQAVSGKSETTEIPVFIMHQYLKHFKRVVLWLDPDEAGIRASNKYKDLYPELEVVTFVPEIKGKDPTDVYEINRYKYTTSLVSHMLRISL